MSFAVEGFARTILASFLTADMYIYVKTLREGKGERDHYKPFYYHHQRPPQPPLFYRYDGRFSGLKRKRIFSITKRDERQIGTSQEKDFLNPLFALNRFTGAPKDGAC